jgi:beta-glucosidase
MPQKYLDPSLPISERVQDLLSRLTLPEKISQMCNSCAAIPRLGIPAYDYWSEGLHGVARNGRATVFPQAIGMAATWDRELVRKIASAIGDEGRAKYHEALRRNGGNIIYQGLTFWSPNVNIFRDPRWGRGQETWGEDPYLTGEMGSEFVRGMQGDHPKYMKAAACAKHYAVHSGPEKDRHTFNVHVSRREMSTTYLPAFRKLVEDAKVEAVMGAYNRVNDEPACGSQLLLVEFLREKWGFDGHVVSDCGALNDFHMHHKITAGPVETAALALKAGCDMACVCSYEHLDEAVERGLVTEEEIDTALARTLATRFKLGMFDPPEQVPFASTPMSVVGCQAHKDLAYEAALKSVVLLKNKNNILPIRESVKIIELVGPNAASVDALLGNYFGLTDHMVTLLEGIVGAVPEGVKLEYHTGCQLVHPNDNPMDWSIFTAAFADLTIACMGINRFMEGEEGETILAADNGDRRDIALPQAQVEYIKKLAAAGAKIVLVLSGGSPIALGEAENLVEAIVFVWYPGQEGGRAVADVLFGKAVPSGKLPLTFPKSLSQLPPFEDYSMEGRTYRFMKEEPLYPFGFGLSYTQFAYSDLRGPTEIQVNQPYPFHFTLTNQGNITGEEVVQVYIDDLDASLPVPMHSLAAFERVTLKPGESRELSFEIGADALMLVNEQGELEPEAGQFKLTVGSCSPSQRGLNLGAPQPLVKIFTMK